MNMKIKTTALLLCLIMPLTFCSCKKNDKTAGADGSPEYISDETAGSSGTTSSASLAYVSAEEMMEESELIVVAECTDKSFKTVPDLDFLGDKYQYEKSYTNYGFEPITVIKGEVPKQLLIRQADYNLGELQSCEDICNETFLQGEKYLMYLKKFPLLSSDDVISYYLTPFYCFKLTEDDNLNLFMPSADALRIKEQYDAATGKSEYTSVQDGTDTGENSPQKGVTTSASYVYTSPEELQTKADMVFVGEYTGQSFETIPDESFVNKKNAKAIHLYEKVYTNYVFKTLGAAKGKVPKEIRVRCPEGTIDGTLYSRMDNPQFKEGTKYFIYSKERDLLSASDKTSYRIITEHCFEVDETGKLIFTSGQTDEDKAKFQAQYDAAFN